MPNQLHLTSKALSDIANLEATGEKIQLITFAVTDSNVDDEQTVGNIIFSGTLNNIALDPLNKNTLILTAVVPNLETVKGIVRKIYIYDNKKNTFAYGLVPEFELKGDKSLEAELQCHIVFSDTADVNLNAPVESYVDIDTFKKHNHDTRYYLKAEIDSDIDSLKSQISQIKTVLESGLEPIGHIAMFYSTVAPKNYLIIDGSWWLKTTYNDLWMALQGKPNVEESPDKLSFRISDARGLFPRFLDNSRDLDKDRSLGSYQEDQIKAHSHEIGFGATSSTNTGQTPAGKDGVTNMNVATAKTGGTETRAKNIAYLACIKYQLY
ncbi:phage tail protein [Francisella sp. SYW-9]|uniref:phage tail-collar fiber domain-containing protein n=1 Tax=Francisella sp. SYW-9 TaxID=2610888 RepID=UPI00123D1130|nr:phage tail protein [Francisella sp. SYW-9]